MSFAFFDVRTGLGVTTGILAEIVDLPREDQGMIELLLGVDFELAAMSMYWAPLSTWE
jgi:hypothetical protein